MADAGSDKMDVVRALAKRVSNWGRWGRDDERGTLNLLTPDVVKAAAACVKTGRVFPLGLAFGPDGPQSGTVIGRFNPQHYMTAIGAPFGAPGGFHYSDDVICMPLQCATQWDSLAHVHYDGLLYNGVPAAEALSVSGTTKNGIDRLAEAGIVSRGVLLDVARTKGVERLAPGTCIRPADLDAAERAARVTVGAGDVLLFRTGHLNVFLRDGDRETYLWQGPGLGIDCIEWLRARDVAAVCADNTAIEVMPCEDPELFYPVHLLGIRDMGMPFGEMFDLEALAADCARDGQHTFLFSAPPLKVTGGIGSPVNPVAVK
ncbi:MAG TPA: cyclase family protein [Myxococcota bacterium]|nr:cyclase family protein [Myxococcota bacterium]